MSFRMLPFNPSWPKPDSAPRKPWRASAASKTPFRARSFPRIPSNNNNNNNRQHRAPEVTEAPPSTVPMSQ